MYQFFSRGMKIAPIIFPDYMCYGHLKPSAKSSRTISNHSEMTFARLWVTHGGKRQKLDIFELFFWILQISSMCLELFQCYKKSRAACRIWHLKWCHADFGFLYAKCIVVIQKCHSYWWKPVMILNNVVTAVIHKMKAECLKPKLYVWK